MRDVWRVHHIFQLKWCGREEGLAGWYRDPIILQPRANTQIYLLTQTNLSLLHMYTYSTFAYVYHCIFIFFSVSWLINITFRLVIAIFFIDLLLAECICNVCLCNVSHCNICHCNVCHCNVCLCSVCLFNVCVFNVCLCNLCLCSVFVCNVGLCTVCVSNVYRCNVYFFMSASDVCLRKVFFVTSASEMFVSVASDFVMLFLFFLMSFSVTSASVTSASVMFASSMSASVSFVSVTFASITYCVLR